MRVVRVGALVNARGAARLVALLVGVAWVGVGCARDRASGEGDVGVADAAVSRDADAPLDVVEPLDTASGDDASADSGTDVAVDVAVDAMELDAEIDAAPPCVTDLDCQRVGDAVCEAERCVPCVFGATDAGGDHCGRDWSVTDGALLSGHHAHVGRLVIPEGVTARVAPWDEEAGGALEVLAVEIAVIGVLDASGAGHGGGGGGGGGSGGSPEGADAAAGGSAGPGAADGAVGAGGERVSERGGVGGSGGRGGGPYGGGGGGGGAGGVVSSGEDVSPRVGGAGRNGGGGRYCDGQTASCDLGDGEPVWMGSGGGGGGGGGGGARGSRSNDHGGGGGGGGGAGGRGGGVIRLSAAASLEVRGALISSGRYGGDGAGGRDGAFRDDTPRGDGGSGGDASQGQGSWGGSGGRGNIPSVPDRNLYEGGSGGGGGGGGGGAGGGIAVCAPSVLISGAVTATDADGATTRGGVLLVRGEEVTVTGELRVGLRVDSELPGCDAGAPSSP